MGAWAGEGRGVALDGDGNGQGRDRAFTGEAVFITCWRLGETAYARRWCLQRMQAPMLPRTDEITGTQTELVRIQNRHHC